MSPSHFPYPSHSRPNHPSPFLICMHPASLLTLCRFAVTDLAIFLALKLLNPPTYRHTYIHVFMKGLALAAQYPLLSAIPDVNQSCINSIHLAFLVMTCIYPCTCTSVHTFAKPNGAYLIVVLVIISHIYYKEKLFLTKLPIDHVVMSHLLLQQSLHVPSTSISTNTFIKHDQLVCYWLRTGYRILVNACFVSFPCKCVQHHFLYCTDCLCVLLEC